MNKTSPVEFDEIDGVAVFTLLSSISLPDTNGLGDEIRRRLRARIYPEAVFRMDHVHYLDSAGLSMFVNLQHEFRDRTTLRFCALHPNVRSVFVYSNLLNQFRIDDTLEESLGGETPHKEKKGTNPLLSETKEFLEVEGKYLLTEAGIRFCTQKQIPVRDVRLYRSGTMTGFTWRRINTEFLERIVTMGLVAGWELECTEFLDKRSQLLRLIEVLFHGIVLKRFRPLLKLRLMADAGYRELLAQGVEPDRVKAVLKERAAEVASLRKELTDALGKESADQKGKVLALLDDSVWYLLLLDRRQGTRGSWRQVVLDLVLTYAGRLELAEYVAVTLMEFLQQAEKAHFRNLAEKDAFTRRDPKTIEHLLGDPSFRERLIDKAKFQKEFLVLHVDLLGDPRDGSRDLVVEITVRNKGHFGFLERKKALDRTSGIDEDSLPGEGDDLGLLNLPALRNLCFEQGIRLETSLRSEDGMDETVACLRLIL